MIARIWKGVVRRDDAEDGNQGAWLLRRDHGERTEFITFSLWDSLDAIRSFAGADPEAAVYYPEDDRYLIERDDTVKHYDVTEG